MTGHRSRRGALLVAAATLSALAAGTLPAAAHTHPTPIERAAPGVVFIEARAIVDVALIEHRQVGDEFGIHIGIHQSTWNPVLATSSGFFVDPNGAIVTTGSILNQDLERAKVYAVNHAFQKRYGKAAPLPANPFARHHIGPADDRNDQRLQACYPPNRTNDAGGCVIRATLDLVVYPYVTSQQRYGKLHAEPLPGATKDVAVLRVRGANSMPTVLVAQSTAGASALSVVGFTGEPGPKHELVDIDQHLAQKGGTALKTTGLEPKDVRDAAELKQALPRGLVGGPVIAESGRAVGLLPVAQQPGQPAPRLVTAATIQQVLKSARVSSQDSQVNKSYEDAMHLFKNGHYAASISSFKRTLELFPGHLRAATNLAVAQAQAAKPGAQPAARATAPPDSTATAGTWGSREWLIAGVAAGALLVAAVLLFILRRRRRSPARVAPPDHKVPPTFQAAPVPAGKMSSSPAGGMSPPPAGKVSSRQAQPARPPAPTAYGAAERGGSAPPSRSGSATPVASRAPSRAQQSVASSPQSSTAKAAATETRFCTSCGARVAAHHRFCGSCGERLG